MYINNTKFRGLKTVRSYEIIKVFRKTNIFELTLDILKIANYLAARFIINKLTLCLRL